MKTSTKKGRSRARVGSTGGSASQDTRRLNWLCKYITDYGLNGFESIAWSVYDEDGKSLMNRETVSEDEVGDLRFDRAAINRAMRGVRVPNVKDEPRPQHGPEHH